MADAASEGLVYSFAPLGDVTKCDLSIATALVGNINLSHITYFLWVLHHTEIEFVDILLHIVFKVVDDGFFCEGDHRIVELTA